MKFKIGELALRTGLTTRALRFYEEAGLILPDRNAKDTRYYTAEHEKRLEAVLSLVRAGMSIANISGLAQTRKNSQTGDMASRRVGDILENLQAEISARIMELNRIQDSLVGAISTIQGCHGCHKKPVRKTCEACSVMENREKWGILNLVVEQKNESDI